MTEKQLQELLLATFVDEAHEQLRAINGSLIALAHSEDGSERAVLLQDIFREVHSLKGALGAVRLSDAGRLAHELESVVVSVQRQELEADASFVGLAGRTLDTIETLIGEAHGRPTAEEVARQAMPLSTLFDVFPSMVRDLARSLGKEIRLVIEGGQTEVDGSLLEQLRSPLTHIVRNACDHGVEARGTVTLRASRRGAKLRIEIADDGPGIDPQSLTARAVAERILTAEAAETLSARDKTWLIFRPGLSTKTELTGVSGRGVGLDAVRESIERLRGAIEVDSTPGGGTTLRLSLPLGP